MRFSVSLPPFLLVSAFLFTTTASCVRQSQTPVEDSGANQPFAVEVDLTKYFCHTEGAMRSGSSLCRATRIDCDEDRAVAVRENLTTSECVQLTPVMCFQMRGEDDMGHEWCAASTKDCELWREMDVKKHGNHGQKCERRH